MEAMIDDARSDSSYDLCVGDSPSPIDRQASSTSPLRRQDAPTGHQRDAASTAPTGHQGDAASTASLLSSGELAVQALTGTLPGFQLAQLTPIQEDDRQAVQQAAPRVPGRIRDIHLKLLLAGESGLGKTTLAYQLLRSYSNGGAAITQGHDGSTSSMEQFKSNPESFCTDLAPIMIEDQHLKLHIKIQDMPGWGDDINLRRYLETVMNFIMKQRAADYQERGGNRSFPKEYVSGSLTNGVTACLYFLPPQRVKPVDIIFMSALSQQVVLIPVVAKADTMTVEETARYRQDILQRCLNPNAHITSFGGHGNMPDLKMNIFSFDGEDLAALDVTTAVPPFTLIASEQFDEQTGEPMRRYLWGDCNAADRNHSDFILLKRLLFGDKVNSLWQLLDDAYVRYASFCEAYEAAGHTLPQLVADACAACGPHLEYDDYLKSQTEVKQLQADKQMLLHQLHAASSAVKQARAVAVVALTLLVVLMAVAALMMLLPVSSSASQMPHVKDSVDRQSQQPACAEGLQDILGWAKSLRDRCAALSPSSGSKAGPVTATAAFCSGFRHVQAAVHTIQDSVGLAVAAALNGSSVGSAGHISAEPAAVILTGNVTTPNVSVGSSSAPASSSALLAAISRGLKSSNASGFAASLVGRFHTLGRQIRHAAWRGVLHVLGSVLMDPVDLWFSDVLMTLIVFGLVAAAAAGIAVACMYLLLPAQQRPPVAESQPVASNMIMEQQATCLASPFSYYQDPFSYY